MPSQVTKYKIVISSPSDIVEELDAVSEIIENWNITNSDDYGAMLERVSWKTHATSEIGDRPQAIINKQLDLKDCDILIAIFWTKLGTPTGEAESGTIEEIEEFRKADKPVSIYFSSMPVSLKKIDIEQYKKLSEIIEKYKHDGLVIDYNSTEQFRSKLPMDISRKIKLIRKASIEVPKESRVVEEGTKKSSFKKPIILYPKYHQISKIIQTGSAGSSASGGGSVALSNTKATVCIKPRIYDEKIMPAIGSVQLPSYKWDAQNFEGFWYDFKTGSNSEALEIGGQFGNSLSRPIDHTMRTIPENTLVYSTLKQIKTLKAAENFKTSIDINNAFTTPATGKYEVVGWQAAPYVAVTGKANKLAKLIIEQGNATSEKKSLTIGETWDIGDGWTLTAQSIDAKAFPRQVWLVLSKDGTKLDDRVIAQGQVYVYIEKSFAGETDVPLFVTYVDSIFEGATSDMVQLRYTWAISTSVTEIKTGDKFGKMEVITASSENLILRNKDEPINLIDTTMDIMGNIVEGFPLLPFLAKKRIDSTVDIMGNLKFKVADDPNFLRFYPVVLREQ